jgi:hypothetical protein
MNAYIDGKAVSINPANALGKGGEADVYDIANGTALKIYKQPDNPDFAGNPTEQSYAKARLEANQEKLRDFPKTLPERVIGPEKLATDRYGSKIIGYTMKLVNGAEALARYAERNFRQTAGISANAVVAVMRDLHATVDRIHTAGMVIGDFNDMNVLVSGQAAYLIDADSFQFGKFVCPMFTEKFVDPLLCDENKASLTLIRTHRCSSDWYAFAVMLMQCLLFVHPYGGVYRPKDAANRVLANARTLNRITIFNPEVVYPKPALPFKVLPDGLLDYFQRVFIKDERGEFPAELLEKMNWIKCPSCGTEHARSSCPNCAHKTVVAVQPATRVRGTVTLTHVFRTNGVILNVTTADGRPRWIYHEDGKFMREDGSVIAGGALDAGLRLRVLSEKTLIGKDGQVAVMQGNRPAERHAADPYNGRPMFDVNGQQRYWLQGGQLLRSDTLGPEYVGDVLSGQTVIWAGPAFGFGYYQAGHLSVAFVFDAKHRGIKDTVQLPKLRGRIVDADCVFTRERCWFMRSVLEGQRTVNHCTVLNAAGEVEGSCEAVAGDGSWLSHVHGKCASGNVLFAATDEGIVRVQIDNGTIAVTREFPDTEPFVDSNSKLLMSPQGMLVASEKEISILKM